MKLFASRHLTSHALLEAVLADEYGLSPLASIEKSPEGKPFFKDFPQLHFNLSHSGAITILVVDDVPLGIDVEEVRPRNPGLPRRSLSEKEYGIFLGSGEKLSVFYKLWTKKEAYVKYTGKGLSGRVHFDVDETLQYKHYYFGGYVATVCSEKKAPTEIVWC